MSSRKEEKERRREERIAREQQEREQAHKRRIYAIVVGGILGVAVIVAVGYAFTAGGGGSGTGSAEDLPSPAAEFSGAKDPPTQAVTDLPQAARAAGCELKNPVVLGREHVAPDVKVKYNTNPPTSGNHDPIPATDGVYDQTFNARQTKHFVHTLEHGRIEIQYDPSLPKADIDRLGGLFNEDPYHMLVFPNRRMPYKVAATAWGHLIGCDKVTDHTYDALRAFRDRYRDQGPEQAP